MTSRRITTMNTNSQIFKVILTQTSLSKKLRNTYLTLNKHQQKDKSIKKKKNSSEQLSNNHNITIKIEEKAKRVL